MNKILNNPYAVGGIVGLVALLVSYVHQKFIKKQEKIDPQECIKFFLVVGTVVTVIMMYSKNKLPKYLMKGGSSSNASVAPPNPVQANVVNTNTVKPTLELSDINQTIHTGNPNF